MDAQRLRDLMARGFAAAASKLGTPFDIYRPRGSYTPLCERNHVAKTLAAFEPENKRAGRALGPIWRGVFEFKFAVPGDYFTNGTQTLFLASQVYNLPPQCVLTNRVISLSRPSLTAQAAYSRSYPSATAKVASGWPAAMTERGGGSSDPLGASRNAGDWELMLPATFPDARVGDVISDVAGAHFTTLQAEQGSLGWRLLLRQQGS